MNRFHVHGLTLLALAVVATPVCGQEITGSFVGTVKSKKGNLVAGAVLRLTSPALQGTRVITTDANGNFRAPLLPPGTYTITIEKGGFHTAKMSADVGLGQVVRQDIRMNEETAASETVDIVATAAGVDKTDVKTSTLVTSELMDVIPRTRRGIEDMARLAPGVVGNPASGDRISIRGSQTTGNRVMLNGTDIADNTYTGGNGRSFFVDDAIQEMQVIQSPVHPRYGNFTGGVMNAITRSGGNDFTGIFRGNLSRPDWAAVRPRGDRPGLVPPTSGLDNNDDLLGREYSLVFGGPIIKDRLWFNLATKSSPAKATPGSISVVSTTTNSDGSPRYITPTEGATYVETDDTKFLEGKITYSFNSNHTLEISGSKEDRNRNNNLSSSSSIDAMGLRERGDLNQYQSLMYRGLFGSSLTFEGRYSKKQTTLWGGGKLNRERNQRVDVLLGNGSRYYFHQATFDFNEKKHRDVNTATGHLTWFSPTTSFGSHVVEGGFELLKFSQGEANWQTPTHNRVYTNGINPDQTYRLYREPSATNRNTRSSLLLYVGSEARAESDSTSAYVSDTWTITDRWQVLAGLRYDRAKATDTVGSPSIDSKQVSPRFQVTWDINGDQRWLARAHYAVYTGALHGGFTNKFTYTGSPLNEQYRPKADNLAVTYDRLIDFSGGPNSPWDVSAAGFIGVSGGPVSKVDKDIKAPQAKETSFNLKHSYPNGSFLSYTFARRTWSNFYGDFRWVGNEFSYQPQFAAAPPQWSIQTNWKNDPRMWREMNCLEVEWLFNITSKLSFGGSYSYSTLKGNATGSDSTANSSVVGEALGDYDDVMNYAGISEDLRSPAGFLDSDVPHKATMYWNYVQKTAAKATYSVSLMFNYFGGTPYSLTRSTSRTAEVTAYANTITGKFKTAADYASDAGSWTRYFGPRGFGRDNDVYTWDLKVAYDVPVAGKLRMFTEVTVNNLFNRWLLQSFKRSTAGPTAASLTDPKSGYMVLPWTPQSTGGYTGWGTVDHDNYASSLLEGRKIQLSFGLKF